MHPDKLLADDMGRLWADPLGFVLYAFDWANDPTLQVVEIPEPWASRYGVKYGPDGWACEWLEALGDQVAERNFNGREAVSPVRMATASGHGIGKSAMTAWLVLWIMSTRPYCKGTVTANTAPQLEAKTWAEIGKWTRRCITGHWFGVSTGKGSMRMTHVDHPESWRCDAQTCREENSEAFAGQHAANSTSFYIFDEASAVPDKIWEVAEGGLTDGEPMFFAFGNPTRNSGRFFEAFHRQRHRWDTRRIDSRDVSITNKDAIQAWVDDYGEDSDFVRVRVKGEFPQSSSTQLVGLDVVRAAQARHAESQAHDPLVMGVDVARFGDDQSVICLRRGRDATLPMRKYRGLDTVQLAQQVLEVINEQSAAGDPVDAVFVDGGGVGGGVIDYLRNLGHQVQEVNFGGQPRSRRYRDRRAEMWVTMRDWLKDQGAIDPSDDDLMYDLIGPEYGYLPADNRLFLEKKEDMKKRGIASPDAGDALALTFAAPVAQRSGWPGYSDARAVMDESDYDPFS